MIKHILVSVDLLSQVASLKTHMVDLNVCYTIDQYFSCHYPQNEKTVASAIYGTYFGNLRVQLQNVYFSYILVVIMIVVGFSSLKTHTGQYQNEQMMCMTYEKKLVLK